MRARQYQPAWGRFLSPDPLSYAAAPSLYAFTGSRPLQYRDPSGLLYCSFNTCYADDSERAALLAAVGYVSSGWNYVDYNGFVQYARRHGDPSLQAWQRDGGPSEPDHFYDAIRDGRMVAGPPQAEAADCGEDGVCRDSSGNVNGFAPVRTYIVNEATTALINDLDMLSTLVVNTIALPFCGCTKDFRYENTERLQERINGRNLRNMEKVREAGRKGEQAAGITKNTRRIPSASGKAAYRVPDELDDAAKQLTEVKNVAVLPFTAQLSDFLAWAVQNKYTFTLVFRSTTTLGPELEMLIETGVINRRYLPW
jgi:hypothetical protein